MRTGAGDRIHGIDTWRAGLLLIGPVIHAADLLSGMSGRVLWLDLIGQVSRLFRMEAFFVLSGFLAAAAQQRRGEDWLKLRVAQLAIPLVTIWIIVLPLAFLATARATGGRFVWLPDDPLHLWFLATLVILTPIAWAADRRGWITPMVSAADRAPRMFWAALAAGLLLAFAMRVGVLQVTGAGPGILAILVGTPYFGMFYLGGFLASRSAVALDHLASTRWWVIGPLIWLAAMTFYAVFHAEIVASDRLIVDAVNRGLGVAAAAAMGYAVLATALRIKRPKRAARALNGSAYTVYLVHLLPVSLFAWLSSSARLSLTSSFLLTALGAIAVSVAFHELLVRRSSLGLLLVNGKLPAGEPSAERESSQRAHLT